MRTNWPIAAIAGSAFAGLLAALVLRSDPSPTPVVGKAKAGRSAQATGQMAEKYRQVYVGMPVNDLFKVMGQNFEPVIEGRSVMSVEEAQREFDASGFRDPWDNATICWREADRKYVVRIRFQKVAQKF